MSKSNITQRGTQASGLGIMIDWCSLDSQHGRTDRHPTNVGCSLFRYTNADLRNHINQRPKRKAWSREDNQLALHCYFRSNPTQRGYRKRMMEIWQELNNFQTTSQRLADQVRTIIKKNCFSDLEILEMHQNIYDDQQSGDNTYMTHQILTNKINPSERNHQLRKMKTLHIQTLHNQTNKNKLYHKNKT